MGLKTWVTLFFSLPLPWVAQLDLENPCPPPVLSLLQPHVISPGDTMSSIANAYNLIPDTLIGVNPELVNGLPASGATILIPPMNGIIAEVPSGTTWQDVEAAYGVRADLLFEVNGCQPISTRVFIPGINWDPQDPSGLEDYGGLPGYPLPESSPVGLGYGWQEPSSTPDGVFHSGVDWLAPLGTPVLAADSGLVVFTGQEGNYGNLVVINHAQGRQTRYAHLAGIEVEIGQEVTVGEVIGRIGNTGRPDLAEPHLHFEVRYQTALGWMAQDPLIHFANQD